MKPTTETYKIIYRCGVEEEVGHVTVGAKGKKKSMSFKCEYCKQHLIPSVGKMELVSHGHTQDTVNHTLRQIKHIG